MWIALRPGRSSSYAAFLLVCDFSGLGIDRLSPKICCNLRFAARNEFAVRMNGTNSMKRKSQPKYNNTIGCIALWAAVTRPEGRTAMKWLRLAICERNGREKVQ